MSTSKNWTISLLRNSDCKKACVNQHMCLKVNLECIWLCFCAWQCSRQREWLNLYSNDMSVWKISILIICQHEHFDTSVFPIEFRSIGHVDGWKFLIWSSFCTRVCKYYNLAGGNQRVTSFYLPGTDRRAGYYICIVVQYADVINTSNQVKL